MGTRGDRLERLIRQLETAEGPVPARALAAALHVTDRSIRSYVHQLNGAGERELIVSTPAGYRLDRRVHRERRELASRGRDRGATPHERLHELTRRLLVSGPHDVFALAEDFCVSPSTIEADLGRVRMLLRDYDLVLSRSRDNVAVEGPERRRRRLMRQVLLAPGDRDGESAAHVARRRRRHELMRVVRGVLESFSISLNEYVLLDLCTHLYIALEGLPTSYGEPAAAPARILRAAEAVVRGVEEWSGRRLPAPETGFVSAFRLVSTHQALDAAALDPRVAGAVREGALRLDDHFLVRLYDGEESMLGLAVHVQHMVARIRSGHDVARPFGPEFQMNHPLAHELALYFSQSLEGSLGIQIPRPEVDFLALHLGARFQRFMDAEQLVTITLVLPRFGTIADDAVRRLTQGLHGQAVVERLVTEIDAEVSRRPSDLVVSAVDLDVDPSVPVVRISPLCSGHDLDLVRRTVLDERRRAQRHRVWSALVAFTDERLFEHVEEELTRDGVLERAFGLLRAAGAVGPAFLDDVRDRERRSPTAFGGRFAIPHSLYMDAERTALCVLVLAHPVPWGASAVDLVITLAVGPRERAVFRDVLDELVRVLSDPVGVDALVSAGMHYAGFMAALRRQTMI